MQKLDKEGQQGVSKLLGIASVFGDYVGSEHVCAREKGAFYLTESEAY